MPSTVLGEQITINQTESSALQRQTPQLTGHTGAHT